MINLKDLRDQRAQKIDAQAALLETRKNEKREFTEEEKTKFNQLDDEIRSLDGNIEQAELEEKAAARAAQRQGGKRQKGEGEEKRQFAAKYSLLKAANAQRSGRALDGLEAEMHEEAIKEARESGASIEGTGVPSWLASRMISGKTEKRDMNTGVGSEGGFFVPSEVEDTVIGALRPRLVTAQAGARTLGNLTGNLDIPRNGGVTVSWKGEVAEAGDGEPTISRVQLSPKRVTAYTDVSRQLLRQSSPDVENMLREDFFGAVAASIDNVAINGGGADEPDGILQGANIGIVNAGGSDATDGQAPIRKDLVNLEKLVAAANADMGQLAYLLNPKVRAFFKNKEISSGAGRFVMEQNGNLIGYNAFTTTNVPSDLTKGAGTGLSAFIFGNFNDLLIGQWGGLDFIINEYTKAKNGVVEMIVHQYLDVALRHDESFAAVKDAVV